MDIKSPEARSLNMARIKNKDTQIELFIRKQVFRQGFRFRNNYMKIFGCPDLYILKYKVAIFIHGCFWHQHTDCKYAYKPKSNTSFWNEKFIKNISRDKLVIKTLSEQSIRTLVLWECSIKKSMKDDLYRDVFFNEMREFILKDDFLHHSI